MANAPSTSMPQFSVSCFRFAAFVILRDQPMSRALSRSERAIEETRAAGPFRNPCDVCYEARSAMSHSGPFWDEIEGRAPLPPATQLLGRRVIAVDADCGTITVEFTARAEFCNSAGTIQGGFLAAMLDSTIGPALRATLAPGQQAPTLELKVSFIRPAQVGRLIGHGRIVHKGRSIAFLAGELHDPTGELVAMASATARIVGPTPR